jgi:hypothetical protein
MNSASDPRWRHPRSWDISVLLKDFVNCPLSRIDHADSNFSFMSVAPAKERHPGG